MRNKSKYIIFGATDGLSYAFAMNLVRKEIPVIILTNDKEKVTQLFGNPPALSVVEGEIEGIYLLSDYFDEVRYLFINCSSLSIKDTGASLEVINTITKLCVTHGIRIIYAGSIFDTTLPTANGTYFLDRWSQEVVVKLPLEDWLLDAAVNAGLRVTVIRLSNCWGPNMANHSLKKVFVAVVNRRVIRYPVSTYLPGQFVYMEDAAEVIFRLVQLNNNNPFQVYNYAGTLYKTAKEFLSLISLISGSFSKIRSLSKWMIRLLAFVDESMKDLSAKIHHYEEPNLLDDCTIKELLPDFVPTAVDKAVIKTLKWYGLILHDNK